jgi:hypothetical protein
MLATSSAGVLGAGSRAQGLAALRGTDWWLALACLNALSHRLQLPTLHYCCSVLLSAAQCFPPPLLNVVLTKVDQLDTARPSFRSFGHLHLHVPILNESSSL